MLGIADYGAYCAAFLVFLALPGPGTVCLLSATAGGGLRSGIGATVGIILGDQVWLWLAAAGISALLAAQPALLSIARYAGVCYLFYLGFSLLLRGGSPLADPMAEARASCRRAIWITLLNPKAIVFYLAFIPLFIDPAQHRGWVTFGAMAATNVALTAAYCIALCATFDWLRVRLLRRPGVGRWLERMAGLALIGFGVKLAR